MNTDRLHREFPWMPPRSAKPLPPRQFGWTVLAVAAFILYGSWVPFNLRWQPVGDAFAQFQSLLGSTKILSRSDFGANFLLGVPLGFCLLAWRLLDQPRSRLSLVINIAILWPWCVAFAVFVEFCQLYFPGRTSSGSDILAQSGGAALGMLIYAVAGQSLIVRCRGLFLQDQFSSPAFGFCVLYVTVLVLNQLLPMDFSASPADWIRKYKEGKVVISPFSELIGGGAKVEEWRKVSAWLEYFALLFPVGLLLAFVPYTLPIPQEGVTPSVVMARACIRVFCIGAALAGLLEMGQILVLSRFSSVSEIVLGGASVLCGWAIARAMSESGLTLESSLILGQAWLLLLAVAAWLPFEFDSSIGGPRFSQLNWIPFAADLEKNYLGRLEEILTRVMLFIPFGVVVAAYGTFRNAMNLRRCLAAVLVAAGISLLLEAGQLFLMERVANPTDILLAGVGGWIGAKFALRIREVYAQQQSEMLPQNPPITPPPVVRLNVDDPIRVRMRGE